jgi:phage shock protein PspC (stress-responsive transcriptional regulator)
VAGVCVLLAELSAVDVQVVRLAMVVLALAQGVGLFVYALLWLILPEEGDGGGTLKDVVRGNADRLRFAVTHRVARLAGPPQAPGRRQLAAGLIGVGALVLLYSLGFFAWLGLVRGAAVVAILLGASLLSAELSQEES